MAKIKINRADRIRMAADRKEMLSDTYSASEKSSIKAEIAILLHPTNDAYFIDGNYVRAS